MRVLITGITGLVGSLETKRDSTDVRDIVRGYWLAFEKTLKDIMDYWRERI